MVDPVLERIKEDEVRRRWRSRDLVGVCYCSGFDQDQHPTVRQIRESVISFLVLC